MSAFVQDPPSGCFSEPALTNTWFRSSVRFPLYSQGVEDYRFHYAVFLLNKNVEQLCASQDVLCTDLRQTLPNLANLLLTVTSRASSAALKRPKFADVLQNTAEERSVFEEPLQEALTSPTTGAYAESSDWMDPVSPASTIKPKKRNKSPTPSEKFRLVTATPSTERTAVGHAASEGRAREKGRASHRERIPEHREA